MDNINAKTKLHSKLEVMEIARGGIDNAYTILDSWKRLRKRYKKEKKDCVVLDYKIEMLQTRIDEMEDTSANMSFGGEI